MSSKRRSLILCDSSPVFHAYWADFINRALNMDFRLRVVRPIKKLLMDNTVAVVSLDSVTSARLNRAGIAFRSFEEYAAPGMMDRAKEQAMLLLRQNETWREGQVFQEALYHDGIFLPDLVELYLYDQLAKLIFNTELIGRMVEVEKPDIIIAGDSGSLVGSAARAVAGQMKIAYSSFSSPLLSLKHFFERRLKVHFRKLYEGRHFSGGKPLKPDSQKIKDKNKILMLSDELRHAPQIIPWARELVGKRENELLIIGLNPWPPQYGELNDCLRVFGQYVDRNLERKVRQRAKKMLTSWYRLQQEPSLREWLYYRHILLFDFFKDTISYCFRYHFDKLIRCIEVTKNIIKIEKPDVIAVMDDRSYFGKTVVATCDLMSVPSLILQHGVHNDRPHYGPTHANRMSVYGDFTRRILVKRGVSPEKIVLTGAPQWDELMLEEGMPREEFCRRMGLDESKGIILLSTAIAFNRDVSTKVVAGVMNAVKEFPHMQLLIRAHPSKSDAVGLYKAIAREVGAGDMVVFKKPHDYDSIRCCDILITQYSTVAIDAMIAGKPVITINLTGNPDPMPYAESGAAIGVYRTEDIAPAINSILTSSSVRQRLARGRKQFLAEHLYKADGRASQRVAHLIQAMAEGSL